MSHAEAMDRMYRIQRHGYDLTRKHYLIGRDHLIERLDPPAGAHVLEIACGTGRNLITSARRYPEARLYGFDLSGEMLKSAKRAVDRAGLGERVALARGDAVGFDPVAAFGLAAFERVFVSYALSMIPPWRLALAHGLALTAPGGALSLVDFGRCEELPSWVKAGLRAWLARFHVTPRGELAGAVAAVSVPLGAFFDVRSLARGYAVYARIERP